MQNILITHFFIILPLIIFIVNRYQVACYKEKDKLRVIIGKLRTKISGNYPFSHTFQFKLKSTNSTENKVFSISCEYGMYFFLTLTGKWRLQTMRENPTKYVETVEILSEELPIGSYNWDVAENDALCKLKKGKILELTMSQCYPNMYTCNNGDCITLRYV